MSVLVNEGQVEAVAKRITELPAGKPLNFYSYTLPNGTELVDAEKFPPLAHPAAVEFLAAVVQQDFGFWIGSECYPDVPPVGRGYVGPVFGVFNGKRLKGSDFLWAASMRELGRDPEFFAPRRLARMTADEMARWFSDDSVQPVLPQLVDRLRIARAYGQLMRERQETWAKILARVNAERGPLAGLLLFLKTVPGYGEDPLLKKALLLAMALANRPERFLKADAERTVWPPIVDYHLMRLALRLGMVDAGEWTPYVTESTRMPSGRGEIKALYIPAEGESQIRSAVYAAVREVIRRSGRPMSEIDFLFWSARKYCPEMSLPECGKCAFETVCAKRVGLFQPVLRTTNY